MYKEEFFPTFDSKLSSFTYSLSNSRNVFFFKSITKLIENLTFNDQLVFTDFNCLAPFAVPNNMNNI